MMAEQTLCKHAQPLFEGLLATFGNDRPDIVVCDFASVGCHDFAAAVGATLLLNQPDVLQTISWRWNDWLVPLLDAEGRLTSPAAVHDAIATHQSNSIAGFLSRVHTRALVGIMASLLPWGLGRAQQRCWPDRPASLPQPLGHAYLNQSIIVLQNTMVPFELPGLLLPNIAMTGPILSSDVMRRAEREVFALQQRTPAASQHDTRELKIDAAMREWLDSSPQSVVYVSQGSLFPIHDAPRVLAIVQGLLAANVRVIFKTAKFNAVAAVLVEAGLLPPAGAQPTSPLSSQRIYLTTWVTSQLDVLSHERVLLFFSHCGTNSVFESAAVDVPVLCLPVIPSQVTTGVLLMRLGASAALLHRHSPTLQDDITAGVR